MPLADVTVHLGGEAAGGERPGSDGEQVFEEQGDEGDAEGDDQPANRSAGFKEFPDVEPGERVGGGRGSVVNGRGGGVARRGCRGGRWIAGERGRRWGNRFDLLDGRLDGRRLVSGGLRDGERGGAEDCQGAEKEGEPAGKGAGMS